MVNICVNSSSEALVNRSRIASSSSVPQKPDCISRMSRALRLALRANAVWSFFHAATMARALLSLSEWSSTFPVVPRSVRYFVSVLESKVSPANHPAISSPSPHRCSIGGADACWRTWVSSWAIRRCPSRLRGAYSPAPKTTSEPMV